MKLERIHQLAQACNAGCGQSFEEWRPSLKALSRYLYECGLPGLAIMVMKDSSFINKLRGITPVGLHFEESYAAEWARNYGYGYDAYLISNSHDLKGSSLTGRHRTAWRLSPSPSLLHLHRAEDS